MLAVLIAVAHGAFFMYYQSPDWATGRPGCGRPLPRFPLPFVTADLRSL